LTSTDTAPVGEEESRPYTAPDLFRYRKLVHVIQEKLTNAHDFPHFHLEPFELRWNRGFGPLDRVYSEVYMSDAFIRVHQEVQSAPLIPGCARPRVVVALMLWSDATHLTSFGEAELHPIYLFFGNESKYRRDRPSARLANHIAYLIKVSPNTLSTLVANHYLQLPDSFKTFAQSQTTNKMAPSQAFYTHCARELFHAQWQILLDNDFINAWKNGMYYPWVCHEVD
jgi:hypothetical protein